ncbi:hypothetical protein [Pseudomonas viridiflava]|uniref:hypothetical protein n=1 Tax=Pseudomonas viridiflava TaxID=33069 RepID=UPI0013CF3FC6|nr:hypothetical protein [Pseudomonas viridiflava]
MPGKSNFNCPKLLLTSGKHNRHWLLTMSAQACTKVLSLAAIQLLALEVNPLDRLPLKAHASLPDTDVTC